MLTNVNIENVFTPLDSYFKEFIFFQLLVFSYFSQTVKLPYY